MSDDDSRQPDDDFGADMRAAEYVLGTLTGAERAEFDRQLAGDADLQALVAAWSARLQPLSEQLAPIDPPTSLWPRIATAIDPASVVPLTSRRQRWIIAAGAIAASILLAIATTQFRGTPEPMGVAQLASTTQSAAAFTISLSEQGAQITTKPTSVTAITGKSFELWVVPTGKPPISLGVVDATQPTERPLNFGLRAALRNGVTMAVTLEPAGGSPTGQPTGAIVFAGTLKLAAAD
jgi:anti-sigma-K factor RskA